MLLGFRLVYLFSISTCDGWVSGPGLMHDFKIAICFVPLLCDIPLLYPTALGWTNMR